jgi:maltokinase
MSRFLSEKKDFKNTPAYLGSVQIKDQENTNITIALMNELVPNEGDAWDYMLKELHKVFSNLEYKNIRYRPSSKNGAFERLDIRDIPPQIIDWVGLNIFTKIQTLAKSDRRNAYCIRFRV